MISCPSVDKRVIQRHYDVSTLFYRLLWGPHIHHGLWHGDESVKEAQLQLTDTLAGLASVSPGDSVLDVGCGMGGSSIHLAKHYDCSVVGVTISPFQRTWATCSAKLQRGCNIRFDRADVESYQVDDASFDIIWSIECTEHLFEKRRFFQCAAQWLRPGGRVAICAWLAGATNGNQQLEQQVYDVCEGFFCPSLGTMQDYVSWLEDAGLEIIETRDWTKNVRQTWEICRQRVARSRVRWLAPWIDGDAVMFLNRFNTILEAYQSGAMEYGCFIAKRAD